MCVRVYVHACVFEKREYTQVHTGVGDIPLTQTEYLCIIQYYRRLIPSASYLNTTCKQNFSHGGGFPTVSSQHTLSGLNTLIFLPVCCSELERVTPSIGVKEHSENLVELLRIICCFKLHIADYRITNEVPRTASIEMRQDSGSGRFLALTSVLLKHLTDVYRLSDKCLADLIRRLLSS